MSDSNRLNKVFINRYGIIEIMVRGDQSVESVQAMGDETARLGKELREKGERALVLDNLLEMGEVPAEARKLVVDLVKSSDYDRLAMLGNNPVLKLGANLMLRASGKGSRVRYFENSDDAMAWLLR